MKEQKNIDLLNRNDLLAEERELYELLDKYADAPILPDKDRDVNNMLLRAELKTQLVALMAVRPGVSFKEAVFTLMSRLSENESDIAYHMVVHVVAKYLPALSPGSLANA
ncbi:MAG TPA: hypothetical protein PK228_01070 [Saprospiraceae bacterium]|nr:hypothetical protein [Saprospiraceae bacterium]